MREGVRPGPESKISWARGSLSIPLSLLSSCSDPERDAAARQPTTESDVRTSALGLSQVSDIKLNLISLKK